jgi:anti-sigma B factor antagonist
VKITTKDDNEVKVVGFDGELDTNSAPEAESQLKQFMEQGVKKILLNFEKLDFISSSGLRILLATGQQLKGAGGQLKVCSLNETVQEVFDISGFSTLLDVFENEADALSGF